jgi:outer membrane lipoprotein SlyB
MMKKILASLIFMVMLMTAIPAGAQTRRSKMRSSNSITQSNNNFDHRNSYDIEDEDTRSIWQKHRDKITTAGGAAGGAIVGGMVGGKKGAVIGGIAGGVGAAIYTYKIRKKNRNN